MNKTPCPAFSSSRCLWVLIVAATLVAGTGRGADAKPPAGKAIHLLRIKADTERPWNQQIYQDGIDLKPGADYTLNFWARASVNLKLAVSTKVGQEPWSFFGLSEEVELTTVWQHFALPFNAAGAVPGHSRLTFNFVGTENGDAWIADVSIHPAGSISPNGQAVANGQFLDGVEPWYVEGQQEHVFEAVVETMDGAAATPKPVANVPARSASTPAAKSTPTAPLPMPPLSALKVDGENFVDPAGQTVKFWGVNLVALYPDHARADALADNLAALQVNLVRPHHNLRPGKDWNPALFSGALLRYEGNSREFDTEALDRFDYLNAALRRRGIYLALSTHWTRQYRPGDVDILQTDDKDRVAWSAAIQELDAWDWKKSMEPLKMLPSLDERAAALDEEFVKKFLTHVNPYTGKTYASDPQVLTFEVRNEASFEYGIVCGARFPDYLQMALTHKWEAFAKAAGVEPGDLYHPVGGAVVAARARFFKKLDEDYFHRIRDAVRGTGCNAPITYSNLWRGENPLEMESRVAGQVEDHAYMDPFVVGKADDGIYELSRTALAGKPYFIGELNEEEGEQKVRQQGPTRTMLPLAISAYGSLQNWSGVVWFAWMHGDSAMGNDGWSLDEKRVPNQGTMISDGMMIDHLRTAGILFRRRLVARARETKILTINEPLAAAEYHALVRGNPNYPPGWQSVHEMRKAFGKVPLEQAGAAWMKLPPPGAPTVSDTGEIVKDNQRRQLTVAALQAEAFSGFLDGRPPARLQRLGLEGDGFATVILVADDGRDLAESEHLILSKTGLNAAHAETRGPLVRLRGMKPPAAGQHWHMVLTRPRATAALLNDFEGPGGRRLEVAADGSVELPLAAWNECELILR